MYHHASFLAGSATRPLEGFSLDLGKDRLADLVTTTQTWKPLITLLSLGNFDFFLPFPGYISAVQPGERTGRDAARPAGLLFRQHAWRLEGG